MNSRLKAALLLILLANILKKSPVYLLLYLLAFVLFSLKEWKSLPVLAGLAISVGFFAELIGTRLCLPFGCYEYVNLQPQLLGVALFVPLAWAIFGSVAYLTASSIFPRKVDRLLFASLLMVLLDLAIDPLMTSWNAWVWKTSTAINWFGIPWTNYLGWFLVSLLVFYLYERLSSPSICSCLKMVGPAVYLLEAFTFVLYAPSSVKMPPVIAFVLSLALLIPLTMRRWNHEGRFDSNEG
ncbi:carotenoid biosynthesis protein [Thermococcus sp. 21S7]|uniref:carotenoid biosynthesis protein n=1 Tax=Thermococcus sp. 21S7 TaxID=1638221 RepID=UPI00143BADBE|nr:carotenoid biosynthesis protein [Thermococcus sp. 21S7]NJE60279.1 carotenoid biosynthesis protein [Thermococcus sp. 21S7]